MKITIHNITSKIHKILFAAATALIACNTVQATITLTFEDNLVSLDPYPSIGTFIGIFDAPMGSISPLGPNKEFRMISPANSVGGGGEKTVLNGGEQWVFGDDINLTAVLNTPITGGSTVPGSAAPAGDVGLHQSAAFFGSPFNFLAPTVGSAAALAYGNGTINIDAVNSTITVVFPVLEAQWAGTHFPLGLVDDGIHGDQITFSGSISNVVSAGGVTTFNFTITAEHVIQRPLEDPGVAGFSDWTTQWELDGTGVAPDSIFFVPQSPTSNTGVLIPTPGGPADGNAFDDGRMTLTEAQTLPCGVDTAMTAACVGSCFDYTVTNIAFSPVEVVLPLTTAIPANAVLRKCDGVAWRNFDESGGDTIESAPGVAGDCTAPGAWMPGLVQGYFCVRTTIANGGLNDLDGNGADTQIQDPVGVAAQPGAGGGGGLIPGENLGGGGGCTLSKEPNDAGRHVDLWLIAGFLLWLGVFRRKSQQQ